MDGNEGALFLNNDEKCKGCEQLKSMILIFKEKNDLTVEAFFCGLTSDEITVRITLKMDFLEQCPLQKW